MINLLPPEIKNRYKVRSKIFGVIVLYLIAISVIGIGLAAIFFMNLVNQSIVSDKESTLSTLASQTKQNDSLTTQAAFVESRVSAATQYQEKEQWDEVLTKIASLTPTNIKLTSVKLSVDTAKKVTTVALTGTSPDRRSAVLFQDKLSGEKTFLSPIIQSLSEEDEAGSFTFGIQFTMKNN